MIKTYLKQISIYPVLSKQEEKQYFAKLAEGKLQYRSKILNSNLKFVVSEAKKFMNRGLEFMDLVSAGNIGLTEAIDHFDSTKDVRFITYAVWWIDEEIRRAICETGRSVKIPVNKKEMLNETKWNALSLDSPIRSDSRNSGKIEQTHLDIIEDNMNENPEDETIKKIMSEKISSAIKQLKSREQTVLKLRYGLQNMQPQTLNQIAESLNLSKERVRQIEQEAISQLRIQAA